MRTLRPLVLGLTLLALVSPFLFGKSLWLRDMALFAYPTKMYLRDRLFAGELPLWNPLLGLGRPFLGMVQPGVLYPGNLILALPSPFGVDLFFVAHLFLAAYGMRAWLRALGSDETEASVGGIVLGLSGYLVSMLAGEGFYLVGVAWVDTEADVHLDGRVERGHRRLADQAHGLGRGIELPGLDGARGLAVLLAVLSWHFTCSVVLAGASRRPPTQWLS